MPKHQEPLVLDKNVAPDVASAVGYRPVSASTIRPQRGYRGSHSDDEDFAHVLQLGAERAVPVLTNDGDLINKARVFSDEQSKTRRGAEEWCTRGVVVLPKGKAEQISTLQRFEGGEIDVIPAASGVPAPRNLEDVREQNVGVDLRADHPRAIDLCHHEFE